MGGGAVRLIRHAGNPILAFNPARAWEAGSVLNACVLRDDDSLIRMVYRATNDVRFGAPGGYMSSVGYAESHDGIHFTRRAEPLIVPDQPYENGKGCEDPRVTKVGDEYFIYYTAVGEADGKLKVRIALATTRDFRTVTKHGIVGPAGVDSKAAALLPEPFTGQYIWYYTVNSDRPSSAIVHVRFNSLDDVKRPPAGHIARSLEHYDDHAVLVPTRDRTDKVHSRGVIRGPELGAPPIKTEAGWLLIYCPTNNEDHEEWHISAALLDLNEPWRVIAQAPAPLLRPETEAEVNGLIANITFPAGAIIMGDELYVYYGSGDQGVCLAIAPVRELLDYLLSHPGTPPSR
jgi:predicted GH43/DUF377 family glycosyl hydrolase